MMGGDDVRDTDIRCLACRHSKEAAYHTRKFCTYWSAHCNKCHARGCPSCGHTRLDPIPISEVYP
jgi:hypothetical protein